MKTLKEIKKTHKILGYYSKINNNIASYIIFYLQRYNFSPNYFTYLSLLFGLAFPFLILNEMFFLAAINVNITYLFDNLDGQRARLKNKTSKFGAILDGTVDHIITYSLLVSLVFYYLNELNYTFIIILVLTIAIHGIYSDLNNKIGLASDDSQDNINESDKLRTGKLKLFFKYIAPLGNYSTQKFILTILFLVGRLDLIVYYFFLYVLYTAIMVCGKYYIDFKDK